MKWKRRIIGPELSYSAARLPFLRFPIVFSGARERYLPLQSRPSNRDLIVVLGGDYFGDRILKGAELMREGYAPQLLASGGGEIYRHFESDLAIDFAVAHGYSRDRFISLHYAALNTVDEAAADIQELRRLHVHRYLVVTSAYHTARAGRIFRRMAPDLEVHMIAAPNRYWAGGQWWKNREGRKVWLEETAETFADFLRI